MITYVTVQRTTMQVILTDLAKYWSLKYSGTHAGEVALDLVKKAERRGTAHQRKMGIRLWKALQKEGRVA